jgi:hypothetical protein
MSYAFHTAHEQCNFFVPGRKRRLAKSASKDNVYKPCPTGRVGRSAELAALATISDIGDWSVAALY